MLISIWNEVIANVRMPSPHPKAAPLWDWEAITAIGQIVSAVGVIISLYYLARQIRQSALATAGQTAREAVAAIRNFNEVLVSDPLAERAFRIGAESLAGLNEQERARFAHLAFNFFKTTEDLHFQYRKGILEEEVWRSWRTALATYATSPGFREYWEGRRAFFTPTFQSEYEAWEDPRLDRVDHFARGVHRAHEGSNTERHK